MTIILSSGSIPAWIHRARPSKALLGAMFVGVCALALTWVILQPPAFQAHTLVAVIDAESPLAGALTKAAAEAAVSESVIGRAATSLVETNVSVPEPATFHRLSRMFGFAGAHPLPRDAWLAVDLARKVSAQPGDTPGSLEITARDADPNRAVRVVSAVVDALIADRDQMVARARQQRNLDRATDTEQLKAALVSARKRLAALTGGADPSDIRAAAQHTAKAQARADAIHTVIASGTPPLSDGPAPSASIETTQSAYLTLSQQLETARETLGDRHVTIIALRAGVQQAAANLTAQWKRLARLADADLTTARRREGLLRRSDTVMDGSHRDDVAAARRDVVVAESMMTRAQSTPADTSNEARGYWLMSTPTVPTATTGLSGGLRAFIAVIIGLLGAEMVLAWPALRNIGMALLNACRARRVRSSAPMNDPRSDWREAIDITAGEWIDLGARDVAARAVTAVGNEAAPAIPRQDKAASDGDVSAGQRRLAVPTIMVATLDSPVDTTLVALAIGRAAVDAGLRVLIVEAPRPRPKLAVAVAMDADPEVIDLLGDLRIVLRAEGKGADLYLAPSFAEGARLASTLARDDETPLMEDVKTMFDLVVIDGGRATKELAAAWRAESYVRVGKAQSNSDDASFAAAFDIPVSTLLETVVTSALASDVARRPIRPRPGRPGPDVRWASAPHSGVFVASSSVPFARPVAAARPGGARGRLSDRR